jgi:ornithine carbamoyltransferase
LHPASWPGLSSARGSLLTEAELGPYRFLELVALAADPKRAKQEVREVRRLQGKNIALVFEKASAS